MTTRADIVAEALEWVGTPTQHGQSLKGVASDCAGPLKGIGRRFGMVPPDFDITGYSREPDGTLLAILDRYLVRIEQSAMQAGDALVARFASDPQHLGILVPYRYGGLAIVHADSKRGRIVEHRLLFGNGLYEMKFVAAYAFPGVED